MGYRQPLRVLHLTRDFPPHSKGGISTAVAGMVRASALAGIVPAVVSFDGWRPIARSSGPAASSREKTPDGVDILRIFSPSGLDGISGFVDKIRPSIIHVHHGMLWAVAEGFRRVRHLPLVKTVHVIQAEMNRIRGVGGDTLSLSGQRTALARADRVIVPSRFAASTLLAGDSSLAPRLRVIPHGVDDTEAATDAAARRCERNGEGKSKKILYVGRFSDIKGTPDFFSAIPEIVHRCPYARFVVAGGIPDSPRSERRWKNRLLEKIPEGMQEKIEFTGWVFSPSDLSALYAGSDILVVPSHAETFGLTAMEGMLHGLPAVAAGCGALAETIVPGETGVLFPVGNVKVMANNVIGLIEKTGHAARLGAAGAGWVRRERLWDRLIPGVLRVYAELV